MDERELITYVRNHFIKPPHLQNWLDDDCEQLSFGDKTLLISVDTASEKVDFPSKTSPETIGYFSTSLSLSDIAACGGTPLGVLVSCSIPPYFADKITDIYEGIYQAVTDVGTFLLGGDTNSAGELSLSVVSIGITKPESVLRRHQAKVGDLVAVTGIIELLFTASPDYQTTIEQSFRNEGLPLYWVGQVIKKPGIQIKMPNGEIVNPTVQGFVHKFDGYKLFE